MKNYIYKVDFKEVDKETFLENFKEVFGKNYQDKLQNAYNTI